MAYSGMPYEGLVADGSYSYSVGSSIIRPNAGLVYHNGQWMTQTQYQADLTAQSAASTQTAMNAFNVDVKNKLAGLMTNPDSVSNTAAYKFAFDQGNEAVNRTAAAKGMLNSGNRLADLVKFGQGLASQNYNQTFQNYGNLLNKTPLTGNTLDNMYAQRNYGGSYQSLGGSY